MYRPSQYQLMCSSDDLHKNKLRCVTLRHFVILPSVRHPYYGFVNPIETSTSAVLILLDCGTHHGSITFWGLSNVKCVNWENELQKSYYKTCDRCKSINDILITIIIIIISIIIINPRSEVLPEKLTGPSLFKKFPAFYGNRMFLTATTTLATCPYEPERSSLCLPIPFLADPF